MVSAFERTGYFPDVEVSPLPPSLLLAAPTLIALGEDWRRELKVVFRAHSSR